MKTKILALALMLVAMIPAMAQDSKNVIHKVGVGDISYTPKKEKKETIGSVLGKVGEAVLLGKVTTQQDKYIDAVRAAIVKGVGNARRFSVAEGQAEENELYIDGTITTVATTVQVYTPSDSKQKPYDTYKALITLTINLKDASGRIVNSQGFGVTEYDCTWVKTTEGAINGALALLSSRITKHFNKLYPLSASVIEAGDAKKDKQKELYIDLGAKDGVQEGMRFNVYEIKTIAGKRAQRELGRVKIGEVMGDDVSLCKVQKGGKEIKAALESGKAVEVISYE